MSVHIDSPGILSNYHSPPNTGIVSPSLVDFTPSPFTTSTSNITFGTLGLPTKRIVKLYGSHLAIEKWRKENLNDEFYAFFGGKQNVLVIGCEQVGATDFDVDISPLV